jgi:hypothetical protein
MELFVLCKSVSALADFLPLQFLLCSDFLHAVLVSKSPELPLCTKAVHEQPLFEWGFDVDSYCTPGYVGTHGNVAVLAAVTDTSLQGPFISFKSCIKEGTLL